MQNRGRTDRFSYSEQSRKSQKVWKNSFGINNKIKDLSPKMEAGVRKGKRSLLACHSRHKCSMESFRNSVKVKLGIKVIKLA